MNGFLYLVKGNISPNSECGINMDGECGINLSGDGDNSDIPQNPGTKPCKQNLPPDFCIIRFW